MKSTFIHALTQRKLRRRIYGHEESDRDLGSGLVVVQLNFFRQEINQQVSVLD